MPGPAVPVEVPPNSSVEASPDLRRRLPPTGPLAGLFGFVACGSPINPLADARCRHGGAKDKPRMRSAPISLELPGAIHSTGGGRRRLRRSPDGSICPASEARVPIVSQVPGARSMTKTASANLPEVVRRGRPSNVLSRCRPTRRSRSSRRARIKASRLQPDHPSRCDANGGDVFQNTWRPSFRLPKLKLNRTARQARLFFENRLMCPFRGAAYHQLSR